MTPLCCSFFLEFAISERCSVEPDTSGVRFLLSSSGQVFVCRWEFHFCASFIFFLRVHVLVLANLATAALFRPHDFSHTESLPPRFFLPPLIPASRFRYGTEGFSHSRQQVLPAHARQISVLLLKLFFPIGSRACPCYVLPACVLAASVLLKIEAFPWVLFISRTGLDFPPVRFSSRFHLPLHASVSQWLRADYAARVSGSPGSCSAGPWRKFQLVSICVFAGIWFSFSCGWFISGFLFPRWDLLLASNFLFRSPLDLLMLWFKFILSFDFYLDLGFLGRARELFDEMRMR
jgi:hypothetical protein